LPSKFLEKEIGQSKMQLTLTSVGAVGAQQPGHLLKCWKYNFGMKK